MTKFFILVAITTQAVSRCEAILWEAVFCFYFCYKIVFLVNPSDFL